MVKKKKVSHKKSDTKKEATKKDSAYFEKLAKENLAGWQRAKADYQNLVKRSEIENQQCREYAAEELILELLPIIDNFEHATNHLPPELDGDKWVEGILFVRTQLEKILTDQGVVPIETVGKKFDPELHEATEKEKVADAKQKDIVLAESQRGYKMKGKVIRAARVKVGV